MSKSRKILLTCTTHLVGLALGWQGWVLAHASGSTGQESPGAAPSRRDAAGNGMAAEDVFEFVQGSDSVEKEKREVARAQAEFDRELVELDVPADIEAALSRELEEWLKDDQDHRKPSAKIMALMYHWAARDIAGMMKWAESGAAAQEAIMWHSFPVYEKLSKDKGPEALAAGLNGKFAVFTAHAMAQALGTTGDIDRALALKSSLPKAQWELLRDRFAHTWPMERKDDIAKLAIAENQPQLLLQFVGIKGSEGARWLSQMLADGSLDASFAEQLSKNQLWDELAKSGSVLPLDERIDRLRGSGDADRDVVGEIAQSDVTQLLKEGRDWRYAFRHGEADAAQVLAEISKSLPELASKAPDALRAQVYFELAEEDPARAMKLLEGLPEAERLQIASQAAKSRFANIDPNDFLAALEHVPADTQELWDSRLAAWNEKSHLNYRRLSDDYATWVRQLPPGLDREMALYSAALAADHWNSEVAAELRAEITDEVLKQKIAASR